MKKEIEFKFEIGEVVRFKVNPMEGILIVERAHHEIGDGYHNVYFGRRFHINGNMGNDIVRVYETEMEIQNRTRAGDN